MVLTRSKGVLFGKATMGALNNLDQGFAALCARAILVLSVLSLSVLFAGQAMAGFTDGLQAYQDKKFNEALHEWRNSAWLEDDLQSQGRLGDIYAQGIDGDLSYVDEIEAATWYYLAAMNTSVPSLTVYAGAERLTIRDLARTALADLVGPMDSRRRTEVEERVQYILTSRGSAGFLRLGEIYASSDFANATATNEGDAEAQSRARELRDSLLVFRAIRRVAGDGSVQETQKMPVLQAKSWSPDVLVRSNNADALAFLIIASQEGHPTAVILEKELRTYLVGSDLMIRSGEDRAKSYVPPFELYPGAHEDVSTGDRKHRIALENITTKLQPHLVKRALEAIPDLQVSYTAVERNANNLKGAKTTKGIKLFQQKLGQDVTGVLTARQTVTLVKTAATTNANDVAQFTLGTMYYRGWGVPTNVRRARHWFTLTANKGRGYGYHSLSVLYKEGRDGFGDATLADLYRTKACQGNWDGFKKPPGLVC